MSVHDDERRADELRPLLEEWEIETANARVRDRLLDSQRRRHGTRLPRVSLPLPVAASLAGLLLLGGYWLGRSGGGERSPAVPSIVEPATPTLTATVDPSPLVTRMKLTGLEPRIEVRITSEARR
jgi:hypothetical protein